MENNQKIKCLIVDDEPIARKIVNNYVNQIPFLENVSDCKNGFEALEIIAKNSDIDIIFLDINMPNLTGLELSKIIKNDISIILTTAYSDFALESYEVGAVDYLLKPFSFERFTTAVYKAIANVQKPNLLVQKPTKILTSHIRIFIKSQGINYPILLSDIIYCEAMKNYTKIVLSSGNALKTLIPFSKMEKEVLNNNENFVRVHRSFLVSKFHIQGLKSNAVIVNNIEIPIGSQYKDLILKEIGFK